jgi:cytochrome c-type biogenesis protein CcmH/NrfG
MYDARTLVVATCFTVLASCGSEDREAPVVAVLDDPALDAVREWASPAGTLPAATPPATEVAPVSAMIGGLEQRLRNSPDDAQGWSLLAQSYAFVDRMGAARDAIDRAVALGASRTELEARVLRANDEAR